MHGLASPGLTLDALRRLDPARLAEVRAAAQQLIQDCPYNRATVGLGLVLHHLLADHGGDGEVGDRLADVQRGLRAQVEVYTLLGIADLPAPGPGTYLYDKPAHRLTADELGADPVALPAVAVADVRARVDAYDPATKARIDAVAVVIDEATEEQWPFKEASIAYRDELNRIAELAAGHDERLVADARAASDLIANLLELQC